MLSWAACVVHNSASFPPLVVEVNSCVCQGDSNRTPASALRSDKALPLRRCIALLRYAFTTNWPIYVVDIICPSAPVYIVPSPFKRSSVPSGYVATNSCGRYFVIASDGCVCVCARRLYDRPSDRGYRSGSTCGVAVYNRTGGALTVLADQCTIHWNLHS